MATHAGVFKAGFYATLNMLKSLFSVLAFCAFPLHAINSTWINKPVDFPGNPGISRFRRFSSTPESETPNARS